MSSDAQQYLYLTTTGHKSGDPHEIEIWYVAHGGRWYLVSEKRERAHWVQNIQHDPAVVFRVGMENHAGYGRVVNHPAERDLVAQVKALMDAKYGWSNGLIVELTIED